MPASLDPQLALDERAITHPELEAALERRLRAKDDVAEVREVYTKANEEVQGHLVKIPDLTVDQAIRVGRFRITKSHVEARSVSFETEPRDQIRIGLAEEEAAPTTTARRPASDDDDLRPTGEINADALRGEADRASEPTSITRPRGDRPPAPIQ